MTVPKPKECMTTSRELLQLALDAVPTHDALRLRLALDHTVHPLMDLVLPYTHPQQQRRLLHVPVLRHREPLRPLHRGRFRMSHHDQRRVISVERVQVLQRSVGRLWVKQVCVLWLADDDLLPPRFLSDIGRTRELPKGYEKVKGEGED